jgi:hydroxymethylpyrimidine/phosphomethylpyrimidine kinase
MVLTIAGSDPTGGAGLQADLQVFHALGVHGAAVPAALTVQNTGGIESVHAVEPDLIRRQLAWLLDDVTPHALKTGMLYTAGAVEAVAEVVRHYELRNLVVDPVAVSSSGTALQEGGALEALRSLLFPLARVVTPNMGEAGALTNTRIEGEAAMVEAARALKALGPECVVVTGGHLEGSTVEIFHDDSRLERLVGSREGGSFHGTGCAFSSALAAGLALGCEPLEAAERARDYVHGAIRRSHRPGTGMALLGY